MNTLTSSSELQQDVFGTVLSRAIGWICIGILISFLINNVLQVGFGFPFGVVNFNSVNGIICTLVYFFGVLLPVLGVIFTPKVTLREDAARIHDFNVYLVRALYFAVLFIGVVDILIAFLRVEQVLGFFFSDGLVRELGKSSFVGRFVHIPLIFFAFIFALFQRSLGFVWLALLIVVAELSIVICRFVFSYEQALMGDLVRYWYAALFLFASAYTLYDDGHVRVDVLYAGFSDRTKGLVNAVGSIFLGLSTSIVIILIGLNGKTAIINKPVMNFEITQQGNVGMFIKYQMAAFIGIFAITMFLQFISYFLESLANYKGYPGKREIVQGSSH